MVAGHLQEKKGYFYMVLNYTVGGKRKTKWIPTGMVVKGNKKKAEALLWETRQTYEPEVEEEVVELSGEIMFVDFLAMWLEIAKSTIKLTTYASYAEMTNKIIIPYFKPLKRRLTEVTAADIQKFYLVQLERVSANSVIHYHAIIHRAMKYAVKTDLIISNPVDKVDRPKKNEFQGSFYTEDEIQDLFEVARGTKLELPIVLAAFYGLRRSEVSDSNGMLSTFSRIPSPSTHTYILQNRRRKCRSGDRHDENQVEPQNTPFDTSIQSVAFAKMGDAGRIQESMR